MNMHQKREMRKNKKMNEDKKGMSKIFECSLDNISLHLKYIFEDN